MVVSASPCLVLIMAGCVEETSNAFPSAACLFRKNSSRPSIPAFKAQQADRLTATMLSEVQISEFMRLNVQGQRCCAALSRSVPCTAVLALIDDEKLDIACNLNWTSRRNPEHLKDSPRDKHNRASDKKAKLPNCMLLRLLNVGPERRANTLKCGLGYLRVRWLIGMTSLP